MLEYLVVLDVVQGDQVVVEWEFHSFVDPAFVVALALDFFLGSCFDLGPNTPHLKLDKIATLDGLERITVHHSYSHVRVTGNYVWVRDDFQTGTDLEEDFLIVLCRTEDQFVAFYIQVRKK